MSTDQSTTRVGTRSLTELLARAGIRAGGEFSTIDVNIVALRDDSRKVEPGDCFFAVRGAQVDGHRFIPAAVRAGAAAIVTQEAVPPQDGAAFVQVPDSRVALAGMAAAYYGLDEVVQQTVPLVGITGTNGKTTTAWIIRSILQAAGRKVALFGTVEYDLAGKRAKAALTTPGPLELCRHLREAIDAGAEYGVMEVSSHALDQHRTDGLVYAAGLFTSFSGDHLDYHQTSEQYFAAKRKLFEALHPGAAAIINGDDPVCGAVAAATQARVVRFGLDAADLEVRGRIESMDRTGSRFTWEGVKHGGELHSGMVGRHNVMNALAAAATAEALGIDGEAIAQGISQLSGVPGRLERVEPAGCPFSVFVDYAHTDDALVNVLSVLRPITQGRLLCVFGAGGDRDRGKRPRMAAAVGRGADVAFVTSDNPRTEDPQAIIDQIVPGFEPAMQCRVEVDADRRRAIQAALAEAQSGDTVLIAGKGHEDYQIIGTEVLQFDDREVAREYLASRRGRKESDA